MDYPQILCKTFLKLNVTTIILAVRQHFPQEILKQLDMDYRPSLTWLTILSLTALTIYKRKAVLWLLWLLNAPLVTTTYLFKGWFEELFVYPLILRFSKFYFKYIDGIFWNWNGTKEESESIYRKLITGILLLNLRTKFQKLKLTSLTRQFSKLVINSALTFIPNQLINKVIFMENPKTHLLWRIVLHIVKLCAWIKFATTRAL